MPVYPLRFTRYDGPRHSTAWAWWHLARASLARLEWGRMMRWVRAAWVGYVVVFFALSWIVIRKPFAWMQTPEVAEGLESIAPISTRLFAFLYFLPLFLVIFCLFAGAGLMADDRRTGALFLYLSKPVTRFQYLFSRIAFMAGVVGFFSVLPALGLYVLELLLSDRPLAVLAEIRVVPALLGEWVILTVLFGLPVLVLSSLFDRGRVAGAVFVGLWFLSQFAGGIIDLALGAGWGTAVDLERLVFATANALLQPPSLPTVGAEWYAPPGIAFAAVTVYLLVGLAILWWRSKPTGTNR